MVNVVPKVVILDIDVLGSWPDLWDCGNLNHPAIVFKNPAVNSWLGAAKLKAQFV